MKNKENRYSYRRRLYGRFTVLSMSLTALFFLISQLIKDGVFGVNDISVTFGILSYSFLTLSAIFLRLEINYSDKEDQENK